MHDLKNMARNVEKTCTVSIYGDKELAVITHWTSVKMKIAKL